MTPLYMLKALDTNSSIRVSIHSLQGVLDIERESATNSCRKGDPLLGCEDGEAVLSLSLTWVPPVFALFFVS